MDSKTVVQAKKGVATVKLADPKATTVKKPYSAPKLTTYGNVQQATKSINKGTLNDGMASSKTA